jgi:hypothetical protein
VPRRGVRGAMRVDVAEAECAELGTVRAIELEGELKVYAREAEEPGCSRVKRGRGAWGAGGGKGPCRKMKMERRECRQ